MPTATSKVRVLYADRSLSAKSDCLLRGMVKSPNPNAADSFSYCLSASLLAAAVVLLIIVTLPSIKSKREEAFVED